MFTMAKLRSGSTYLAEHLTANDYYSEKESVSGVWVGQAAEKLGLAGREIGTKDEAFERLRCNRHPLTGRKLTAPAASPFWIFSARPRRAFHCWP
jgi:hypothetical protein